MRIRLAILLAVFSLLPRISAAQALKTYEPPKLPRIYVDVNLFGYADPLTKSRFFETYLLRSGEVATFKATYPKPSRSAQFPAYLGGGFMMNRTWAIGVSYSRMSRETDADLFAQVPHPAFFNAMANDTGTIGTFSFKESAVHISLAAVPVRTNRIEFRLMGGPSFFTLKGEMAKTVEYQQTFDTLTPQNAITVNGSTSAEASGTWIGFHLGADVTYFVHRLVGVAGGVRYGRSTVDLREPLSNIEQQFRVGSTTIFLGLRFRFGRAL